MEILSSADAFVSAGHHVVGDECKERRDARTATREIDRALGARGAVVQLGGNRFRLVETTVIDAQFAVPMFCIDLDEALVEKDIAPGVMLLRLHRGRNYRIGPNYRSDDQAFAVLRVIAPLRRKADFVRQWCVAT